MEMGSWRGRVDKGMVRFGEGVMVGVEVRTEDGWCWS